MRSTYGRPWFNTGTDSQLDARLKSERIASISPIQQVENHLCIDWTPEVAGSDFLFSVLFRCAGVSYCCNFSG